MNIPKLSMTTKTTHKSPSIVTNKTILEEITFHGKKITRERVVKQWNIPKTIKDDIGYQMMFGHRSSSYSSGKTTSGISEVEILTKNI